MPKGLLETIDAFMREVGVKTAEDGTKDPGGYMGETTHPSKSIDNKTQKARTGSRASENEKDVKEDHPGAGVDNTTEGSGGSEENKMPNIGTHQSATGEDSKVEDNYKKDKTDPPSTHPSHSAEDQGEKYSSMQFPQLCKVAGTLANEILADFANGFGFGNQNPASTQKIATVSTPTDQEIASKAGYELSALLGQQKQASEKQAYTLIEQTIKDAEFDADLVGSFFKGYNSEKTAQTKRSDDMGGMMPPGGDAGGMPPGGPMGPPPGPEGPPPGPGGDNPQVMELQQTIAQLQQLLEQIQGGGGGAGGEPPMPPPGPEGMPPDVAGDAGAGGGPPMLPPGDPNAEVKQAVDALTQAVHQLGGSDVVNSLSLVGPEGAKLANAVKDYQRSGQFTLKIAKTAKEQRLVNDMKAYVREILGW